MAVRFILGESGQGKTWHVMEEAIRRSGENPRQNYYMIVPEQYSLQMQRDMVLMHPNRGFFNIDILSFFRLAYRVFDECCREPKELLEDLGAAMILKKILVEHKDELLYYKKSMHKQGFLDELKSMIMEFISYGISVEQLTALHQEKLLKDHPALCHKCRELGLVYGYFMEEIAGQYMVMEQTLDLLCDFVDQSPLLREGVFYFDGFTGFTPVQLKFLERLLPCAREAVFTVTIPDNPLGAVHHQELFHFSEKTIERLLTLCKRQGIAPEEPVILQDQLPKRYAGTAAGRELAHFQKNILRPVCHVWDQPISALQITECRTPEEEAEYVLHKAEELVRTRRYRYRDMAVLTGNEEEYIPAFVRQAQSMGIPLFVDAGRQLNSHPGVETVRSLFYLAEKHYSYESVFRYLKSGMSFLSDEEIDFLENYVIASGIRGYSMWKEPFRRGLSRYEPEEADRLQVLREKVMEETEPCYLVLRDRSATVQKKLEALTQAFEKLQFEERFLEKAKEYEAQGNYEKMREYRQFYSLLTDLAGKMTDIFGDSLMSVQELAEIMDTGLSSLEITVAPLSLDQLIVGDMKRTRLPDVKTLFIVGMNDTYIPPIPGDGGLLGDEEKELLAACGVELSLSTQEQVLENDFYLYLAFSRPKESLRFTYALMGNDGSARRASEILKQCIRIFPQLGVKRYKQEEIRKYFHWEDCQEFIREQLRKCREDPEAVLSNRAFGALLHYGMQNPTYKKEIEALWKQKDQKAEFPPLDKSLVQALYGADLSGSVTRMERYAACPYQFFCIYGLRLREREEFKVQAADLGTVFHHALESYSKKIRRSSYTWKTLPEALEAAWKKEALSEAFDDRIREVLQSTARNRHYYTSVERIFNRTVEILKEQLSHSDFEPDYFEFRFGKYDALDSSRIPLADGRSMKMEGIIDRIDLCEQEDAVYVRIIDYKSGNQSFDLHKMYWGLQLQLVVYMNAALELYAQKTGKKTEPAGIYYYNLKDPVIKAQRPERQKFLKAFRLSGYSNSNPEILDHLEKPEEEFISIPVRMTKNHTPYSNAPVMTTDQFLAMGRHVKGKLSEAGNAVYEGKIEASPYKNAEGTACDYCPYQGVCGFDTGLAGYHYKEYEKQSAKEILERFREQVD